MMCTMKLEFFYLFRNEINRKADAMTKLKSEMDRLVRQQAIRTGTRSEYEKVFETYKASLEQFVLRF